VSELLKDLEPRSLWRHFFGICRIPRCSGSEEAIRAHVVNLAEGHGLAVVLDGAGNVIVRKEAHPEMKDAPVVVLQSHLDMVCEKNLDVAHDFTKDPLKIVRTGDWIGAEGTTLGSDNGIGVAAMLAVLEDRSLVHGPLEVLFTVDEERGLGGASRLASGSLQGEILLNFDSEEEGTFVIGCAGGGDSFFKIPVERKRRALDAGLELKITGLRGGHSGIDIHLGRGNALKMLARALVSLSESVPFELVGVQGGDKHNAIPREAVALLQIRPEDVEKAREILDRVLGEIQSECSDTDPDLGWGLTLHEMRWQPLTKVHQDLLIDVLRILPHGVLAASRTMAGLVETSTNLASVRMEQSHVEIVESSRSARESSLEEVRGSLRALARIIRCEIKQPQGYPGWLPEPDSPFVARMKRIYEDLFGKEPEIKAVHAGLEPGVLSTKCENVKMISFGPDIRDPHSPRERVSIPSVERFWKLLVEVLRQLRNLDP